MTIKYRLLISDSYDPWFNITIEDCIFNDMNPNQIVLFLWRNIDTVIIGRAQNPWKECNLKKMEKDNIKLSRRRSGGGAVYQDLGNTCFTFMAGKNNFNKKESTQLVIKSLAKLGIIAEESGRNDLVIKLSDGPRKISGSAYREKFDRGFYHGTLLRNVDMGKLADYLNPDKKKLAMKGIESVRSRVMNLVEIKPDLTHEMFCKAIHSVFEEHYQTKVIAEYISPDNITDFPNFNDNYNKQRSWEWNFGNTLEFSHHLEERFLWGGIDLHIDVKNGIIEQTKIFTDALDPSPLENLTTKLIGLQYKPDDIAIICDDIISQYKMQADQLTEFKLWLIQQI